MTRKLKVVDLFCGGGGTSEGIAQAAEARGYSLDLLAVNHWERAIETHAANHPQAEHLCARIDAVNPSKVVRGKLDLLVASPECTHFSTARGGKPMNDQSRASGFGVVDWIAALQPRVVLVENIVEYASWGPLNTRGRPIKSRKGETFQAWLSSIRSLGYSTSVRVLNAADFGDPTTRRRLFVLAWRGRGAAPWPIETHAPKGEGDLFGARKPWRAAREIIDWSLVGTSIFGRKRPLAEKTIARIAEGLRRFGGAAAEPFLAILTHGGRVRSLDDPLPTVTGANRGELGLVHPFVIGQQSGSVPRPVTEPLPTLAASGAVSLVEPFLVPHYSERDGQTPRVHSIDSPMPTIPGSPQHALAEPFLVRYHGTGGPEPIDRPLPTVTTRDRFGLVEPARLDIRFRMLAPHELAAAMGFPADYVFCGTRTEQIKQVGNAVSVSTARALAGAVLEQAIERRATA